jgi:hypothetical protein
MKIIEGEQDGGKPALISNAVCNYVALFLVVLVAR